MKNMIEEITNNLPYKFDFSSDVKDMIDTIKDNIIEINQNMTVNSISYNKDTNIIEVSVEETVNYDVYKINL